MAKKTKKAVNTNWYVLYGYHTADEKKVGYFGTANHIVEDLIDAKKFPDQNVHGLSGYGLPEQWVQLINTDHDLNHGFKFHLVKISSS